MESKCEVGRKQEDVGQGRSVDVRNKGRTIATARSVERGAWGEGRGDGRVGWLDRWVLGWLGSQNRWNRKGWRCVTFNIIIKVVIIVIIINNK